MLKSSDDVINNILLKIGASKEVIDYYCKDNKKVDNFYDKLVSKKTLTNGSSVKLVSSYKNSIKAPKPSKPSKKISKVIESSNVLEKECSSTVKPKNCSLKVTSKIKRSNINDLERKLVALILKKKTHSCGEPNTISIVTVYRVLERSFKELRREIPDFDAKFSTTGTGAGTHIKMLI
jgi:hypothetical protein